MNIFTGFLSGITDHTVVRISFCTLIPTTPTPQSPNPPLPLSPILDRVGLLDPEPNEWLLALSLGIAWHGCYGRGNYKNNWQLFNLAGLDGSLRGSNPLPCPRHPSPSVDRTIQVGIAHPFILYSLSLSSLTVSELDICWCTPVDVLGVNWLSFLCRGNVLRGSFCLIRKWRGFEERLLAQRILSPLT